MSNNTINLDTYLARFTESDWLAAVEKLLPEIHAVDKNAVQIWFRFYPLSLTRELESAENIEEAVHGFALQGDFGLGNKIDTSHSFLYGHRYWRAVKTAIEAEMEAFKDDSIDLAEEARHIALIVAEKLKTERALTNGIALAGLMTLNQVGAEAFKAAAGEPTKPNGVMTKSPDQIVAERGRDDSQGVLGFLKTINKKFSIGFIDLYTSGSFQVIQDQEIASASANDRSQNWQENDARCWEGPVPVECTAASCGTCWVGVLGGEEKLSEVSRRERRAMKVFGYGQSDDAKPIIRLACQAKAGGNATIVIPPWNAVFGKKIYGNVEDLELEPNTTSAKRLREIVKEATSGE